MTKKVNKHITENEDFFKRLDTGDESGLDDFEKEALEGFASLENPKLAKELNDSLNSRIEGTYFKSGTKGNSYWYLAMAAGFVLVLGLSVFFFNFLNTDQDLAIKKDATITEAEAKPQDMAPASAVSQIDEGLEKKPEESSNGPASPAFTNTLTGEAHTKKPKQEEPKLVSRSIPGNQAQPKGKTSENYYGEGIAKDEQAPASTTGILDEEQRNFNRVALNEKTASPVSTSVADKLAEAEVKAEPQSVASGSSLKRDEAKEESSKSKKASKAPNQSVPAEMLKAEGNAPLLDVTSKNNDSKNAGNAQTAEDKGYMNREDDKNLNTSYSSAQAYIKNELEKNASLKAVAKSFKALLTIEANGIVSKAELKTEFNDCKDCNERLKTILLNMPADLGLKLKGKKGKNQSTVELIYP